MALNGGDIGQGALIGGAFATATSPQLRNALKGQGFRSNNKVLAGFVERGDYQGALDHFGFEGEYAGEGQSSTYYDKKTGETGIRFRSNDFGSYGALKSAYIKESFHLSRVGNWEYGDTDYKFAARQPEERLGLIEQYRKAGIHNNRSDYLKIIHVVEGRINMFNQGFYNTSFDYISFTKKWWHFLYRIPRRY